MTTGQHRETRGVFTELADITITLLCFHLTVSMVAAVPVNVVYSSYKKSSRPVALSGRRITTSFIFQYALRIGTNDKNDGQLGRTPCRLEAVAGLKRDFCLAKPSLGGTFAGLAKVGPGEEGRTVNGVLYPGKVDSKDHTVIKVVEIDPSHLSILTDCFTLPASAAIVATMPFSDLVSQHIQHRTFSDLAAAVSSMFEVPE